MTGLFDDTEPTHIPKTRKPTKKQAALAAPAPTAKVIPTSHTDDEQNILNAVQKFKNAGML